MTWWRKRDKDEGEGADVLCFETVECLIWYKLWSNREIPNDVGDIDKYASGRTRCGIAPRHLLVVCALTAGNLNPSVLNVVNSAQMVSSGKKKTDISPSPEPRAQAQGPKHLSTTVPHGTMYHSITVPSLNCRCCEVHSIDGYQREAVCLFLTFMVVLGPSFSSALVWLCAEHRAELRW